MHEPRPLGILVLPKPDTEWKVGNSTGQSTRLMGKRRTKMCLLWAQEKVAPLIYRSKLDGDIIPKTIVQVA